MYTIIKVAVFVTSLTLVTVQAENEDTIPIDIAQSRPKGPPPLPSVDFHTFLEFLGKLVTSFDLVKGSIKPTVDAVVKQALKTLEELSCGVDNKCMKGMRRSIYATADAEYEDLCICLDSLSAEAKITIDLAIIDMQKCMDGANVKECKSQYKACFKQIKELVQLPTLLLDGMIRIMVAFTVWTNGITICANDVFLKVSVGILEIFCKLTECLLGSDSDYDHRDGGKGESEIEFKYKN